MNKIVFKNTDKVCNLVDNNNNLIRVEIKEAKIQYNASEVELFSNTNAKEWYQKSSTAAKEKITRTQQYT